MRLVSLLFAFAMVSAVPVAAHAAEPDLKLVPRDEAALQALDAKQLRIVRRARAQCWHSGEASFAYGNLSARGRACVIAQTEGAIASSGDPVLQAFHAALPYNARYDEFRPAFYWQRLAARQ